MHWGEETFWKSTPRRFKALLNAATELEQLKWGGKKQQQKAPHKYNDAAAQTIDNIPGWS